MFDDLQDSDLFDRVTGLLGQFFNEHRQGWEELLATAFKACPHDPRSGIKTEHLSPTDFATHCVTQLWDAQCLGAGRHPLGRLLEVCAERDRSARSARMQSLAKALHRHCRQPPRELEQHYLEVLHTTRFLAASARLYAPLDAVGVETEHPAAQPLLACWEDRPEFLIRPRISVRQSTKEGVRRESRHFEDIQQAFDECRRVVVLGQPGAGKSTALHRYAHRLALQAQEDPKAPIPFYVRLGFWTEPAEDPSQFLQRQIAMLADYAPGSEAERNALRPPLQDLAGYLTELCKANRALLLLDGLNELPSQHREQMAEQLRDWLAQFPTDLPVYLACRQDDYQEGLQFELDELTIEPLTVPRIRSTLRQIFQALDDDGNREDPTALAEGLFWALAGGEPMRALLAKWQQLGGGEDLFWTAEDLKSANPVCTSELFWDELTLWREVRQDPHGLLSLATNPYMLTLLILHWREGKGALPSNQSALFQGFVESLLVREKLAERERRTRKAFLNETGRHLVQCLAALAWELQTRRIAQAGSAGGDSGVSTTLSAEETKARLGTRAFKRANDARILDRGDGVRFSHQLLQEYFTALGMRERIEKGRLRAAQLWETPWERSGWEVATRLLAGLYPEDCTPVLDWLGDSQPEVTADCILHSGAHTPEAVKAAIKARWLPRLTDPAQEPEPSSRAALGRVLGRLGLDDRKGVGCDPHTGLPDIDWIEVPAGEFLYGEARQKRRLAAFRISRYPITNAQFDAFVHAGGYGQARWWQGLAERIEQPDPAAWHEPNHPRERVSWYEAMAFCAWLSDSLDLNITLPTEAQWEKTARGVDGRVYPWGVEWRGGIANTWESQIGRTSPVGIFPQDQSPYGVMELAGNLWEWCLNEYAKPKKTQRKGDESRVLRGGSWDFGQDDARAVYRLDARPGSRDGSIGFRVLCASPIR